MKKPKIVLVVGEGRRSTKEAIEQALKSRFPWGKILFFEADSKDKKEVEDFKFLARKTSLFVLVASRFGNGLEERKNIEELIKILPSQSQFVLNLDDQRVREIESKINSEKMTFGFEEGADLRASDINLSDGANFKINYKGNSVPVWLEKSVSREQIYPILAAVCVGIIFDLNLVEISQTLKNYQP